ncbi:MAG: PAS domain S-box protein, partial [Desulfomonilaceae bacterium]
MQGSDKAREELLCELAELRSQIEELNSALNLSKASESKLREIIDREREAVFVVQDGQIKFANPACTQLTGYLLNEILAHNVIETLVHPDDSEMVYRHHTKRFQSDTLNLDYSFRIICKKGTQKWVEMNSSLIIWEGKPAALCLLADITDRKEAVTALRESEKKYRLIVDRSSVGIIHFDSGGTVTECNQEAQEILGAPKEVIIGFNLTASLKNDKVIEAVRTALSGRTGYYEGEYLPVVGNKVAWLNMQYAPLIRSDGSVVGGIGILQDFTDRKKSQEALLESEQRFRGVFDQGPVGMAILELDYRWVSVNKKLCEITGYTSEELTQLSFMDITHPEDIEKDFAEAAALVRGDIPYYETEKRYINKNNEVVWVNLWWSVVRNTRGEPLHFLAMIQDITPVKKAEQEKALFQAELFQSQKMEALGSLVGGIAHDFNNMLQIITGYCEIVLSDKKENNRDYSCLQAIIQTRKRGEELVQKLMDFGQQSQTFPVPLDLNYHIGRLMALMPRVLPVDFHIKLTDFSLLFGTTCRFYHFVW